MKSEDAKKLAEVLHGMGAHVRTEMLAPSSRAAGVEIELERLKLENTAMRGALVHIRQAVHQAYHGDFTTEPSVEPEACRKGICQAVALALGEQR